MRRLVFIFWNRREARLRAGLRAVLQLTFFFVLMKGLSALFGLPNEITGNDTLWTIVLLAIVRLLRVVISVYLASRFLDRRSISDFGLKLSRQWWQDLGFGAVLGMVLMAGIFLAELSTGWVTVTETLHTVRSENSFVLSSIVFVFLFACVGFSEELLARGYQLTNLTEGFSFKAIGPKKAALVGLILSSVLFGAMHFGSPDVSAVSILIIVMIALIWGLSYLWTGRLAIPIGLHITWNLFQGNVFGFPVSGTTFSSEMVTFFSIEQSGPDLWTGGSFGPEAGLIGLFAIIIGFFLLFGWVRLRYGRIRIRNLVRTHDGIRKR